MDALINLNGYLTRLAPGGVCVAFSGGVDSAVLLKSACEAAKRENAQAVHAVTVRSRFHSPLEAGEAAKLAEKYGARFTPLELELPDEVMQNPLNRCYLCKKAIFAAISAYALENGLGAVLDGTNADDLNEYRPGLKALKELQVKSPLAELGFSKELVRKAARAMDIRVSEKPPSPCLATRIPYNTRIEPETIERIDALEAYLKSLGFAVVRARVHGALVRIEADAEKLADLLKLRVEIAAKAEALGFSHATLDLRGFRSGSWDMQISG